MSSSTPTVVHSRRHIHRLLDVALFVWGVAAATVLVTKAVNDVRSGQGWPRWLELCYVVGVLVAVPSVLLAGWAKARLKRLGAVLQDERTDATHVRSLAAALVGVLCAQLPYFFHVDVPSVAQAQFTVAAALLTYGAARLWLNREA